MIETITKENMDALKDLADTSIKISEMKSVLLELENTKHDYIEKREKEAIEKVDKLLKDSEKTVNKIRKNNAEVHTLLTIVSAYKSFLDEALESFQEMLKDFNERSELWDKKVENQYDEFREIERKNKQAEKEISDGQKEIEKANKQIQKDRQWIADRQQVIKRTVERLKVNIK